jgi:Polypeptide deformylase
VPRFNEIKLKAWDRLGKEIDLAIKGFTARVHQHEIDHGLGEEYLNHMAFSLEELYLIQHWIDQFKNKKIDRLPCSIILNRLECIDTNPDVHALEVWLKNEFKKKEFKKHPLSKSNFTLISSRVISKDTRVDNSQLKAKL